MLGQEREFAPAALLLPAVKFSRMNSALILPQRRIASRAAACIWLSSDLPSSPLIVTLITSPDASRMVNGIVSPFEFYKSGESY